MTKDRQGNFLPSPLVEYSVCQSRTPYCVWDRGMLSAFILGDEIVLEFWVHLAYVMPKPQEVSNFGGIEHLGEISGFTGNSKQMHVKQVPAH
jgi:hypothetical protein